MLFYMLWQPQVALAVAQAAAVLLLRRANQKVRFRHLVTIVVNRLSICCTYLAYLVLYLPTVLHSTGNRTFSFSAFWSTHTLRRIQLLFKGTNDKLSWSLRDLMSWMLHCPISAINIIFIMHSTQYSCCCCFGSLLFFDPSCKCATCHSSTHILRYICL